jgi:hypothetical protein
LEADVLDVRFTGQHTSENDRKMLRKARQTDERGAADAARVFTISPVLPQAGRERDQWQA